MKNTLNRGQRNTKENNHKSNNNNRVQLFVLLLVIFAVIGISGCTGVTGAPKSTTGNTNSTTPTTPSNGGLSVSMPSISFGSVSVGGTVSQSIALSNSGTSSLVVSQVSTTTKGFTITGMTLPATIAAGSQASFNVIFTPSAVGAVSGTVSIVSNAPNTPGSVTVSGAGVAASTLLNSSTPTLNFGSMNVGASNALTVTLSNAGNSNVTISGVNVPGGVTTSGVSSGLTLTPGQNATLNVTYTPNAAGNLTGSISIVSNATNSPAVISLSGSATQTSAHSVQVNWNGSTGVIGYNVYRSMVSGGPYSEVNSSVVTPTSFTDSSVQDGHIYYYAVTSVGTSGVESAMSAEASTIVAIP